VLPFSGQISFRLRELPGFCVVLLHFFPFSLPPGLRFGEEFCCSLCAPVKNPAATGQKQLTLEAQLDRDSFGFHTRLILK